MDTLLEVSHSIHGAYYKGEMMDYFVWSVEPNIFQFGAIQLRWYGVLFVGSFFIGLTILQWVYRREHKDPEVLENFLLYVIAGAVIGARLMHCFAYEPEYYLSHPLEILYVWKGGLASHGGMLGVMISLYFFARKYQQNYLWLLSRTTLPGMVTAAFVRIGNLFNSEILGLPTDKPWAIIFSRVDMVPRHPVQLYEAFSYFAILGILLVVYRRATFAFATQILMGLFFFLLFSARFLLEYTKTEQADYATAIPLTVGQMLSIPFILLGFAWIVWAFYSTDKEKRWLATR